MTSTEWGIKARHLPTGSVYEYYLEDPEEAADEYAAMADLNPDRWEITLGYRTMAAEAGEFTEYTVTAGAKAKAGDDAEIRPQVLSDMISMTGTVIPPEVIATWTAAEREQAGEWVAAEYAHASDHEGVQRLPEPPFVHRAAELTASPALAQLVVEAWTARLTALETTQGPGAVFPGTAEGVEHGFTLEAARDAITGLLVLLRDRQPS